MSIERLTREQAEARYRKFVSMYEGELVFFLGVRPSIGQLMGVTGLPRITVRRYRKRYESEKAMESFRRGIADMAAGRLTDCETYPAEETE